MPEHAKPDVDVIGNFLIVSDYCAGCGKPLMLENAWMTDGCPCNSRLGINNFNETRWRLLMRLQQQQSHELETLRRQLASSHESKADQLSSLIESWAGKALSSNEEADRIRRTVKEGTDAEERCKARADVWARCAEELNRAVS